MAKYFITTPIYYVNDVPHVGSAYTTLAADVLARAHRQYGDETLFITGTDEHGAKIARKAEERGKTPQAFTDEIAGEFQKTWDTLNIKYDRFVRTTDENHKYLVGQVMQRLYDKEYIYPGTYEGWYCVGCEEYKEVPIGSDLSEDPICDIHKKPLEFIQEKIYYFTLSKFQDRLIELLKNNELVVKPESRHNEVLSFLTSQPLRDIPVTRTKVEWGVKVPFDQEQTVYVWVDALLNYLSFSDGVSILEAYDKTAHWWPASAHLLAKDILRFHAIIWPALLMALELPLPREILVHGFFTVDGQKMSKSLGNTIKPQQLIERYGVDASRFLLLAAIPYGPDSDISLARFDALYTAHLANGLGNLLQRVIVLINKFGIKPQVRQPEIPGIKKAYLANDLTEAIAQIILLVDDANRYIAAQQPWSMENDAERETVLVKCYEELLRIAEALVPVMPTISESIKQQLNSLEPQPLFPRLPKD